MKSEMQILHFYLVWQISVQLFSVTEVMLTHIKTCLQSCALEANFAKICGTGKVNLTYQHTKLLTEISIPFSVNKNSNSNHGNAWIQTFVSSVKNYIDECTKSTDRKSWVWFVIRPTQQWGIQFVHVGIYQDLLHLMQKVTRKNTRFVPLWFIGIICICLQQTKSRNKDC